MAPLIRNEQTRLLAGPFPGKNAVTPDSALTRARHNLAEEIHVVGLTERFDESLLAMKSLLHWRSPRYQRRKVAPRDRPRPLASPQIRELIRELNPLDVALYESATQLFDEQLQACGGITSQELGRYRWVNAKSSRVRLAARSLQSTVRGKHKDGRGAQA